MAEPEVVGSSGASERRDDGSLRRPDVAAEEAPKTPHREIAARHRDTFDRLAR
jgi:hypothetical protein